MKLLAILAAACIVVLAGLDGGAEGGRLGVKLCGREFIRAVIFTCGGSRWRRDTSTRGDTSDEFDPRSLWGESSSLQAEGLEAAASPSGDPEPGAPWRHLPGPRGLQRGDRATKAGLASVCCHWGCSKSDISTLC
ncbi:relaxin-3-like isoform X2 [Lethenteron reissneri]|uniref:relaxin-3-like isoform X2 n=1 Tax=Lethenteron reissneri TaxID=7753 RepID=UPI002AB72C84|nr:relaxin-3-like isoform X2 [Lethenteron reissneri]